MSEEKAEYVTAAGKMCAALEAARHELTTISGLSAFDAKAPQEVFTLDSMKIIQEIDDALTMTSPEPDLYSPMQVQRMIREAYDEGKTEQEIETASKLIKLPEQIKTQSLKIAELTNHTEALRLSLAITRNDALELVLSMTENGKPKYGNDKARNMAVEQLLRENLLYLDTVDELSRKECEMRREQIQLAYLENTFLAYRAISGMRGVRV